MSLRAQLGLLPREPEPDLSFISMELVQEPRTGTFVDAFPVHLIMRRTLESLARLAPGSDWDPRRFRANLLLDTPDESGLLAEGDACALLAPRTA